MGFLLGVVLGIRLLCRTLGSLRISQIPGYLAIICTVCVPPGVESIYSLAFKYQMSFQLCVLCLWWVTLKAFELCPWMKQCHLLPK